MAKAVKFSDGALELMEERGIREEDVLAAIEAAENGGDKLYTENGDYLVKAVIGSYTIYAEFKESNEEILVDNVYGHRVTIMDYEG